MSVGHSSDMLREDVTAPEFELSGIDGPGDEGDDPYEFREFVLSELLEDGPVLLAFYPGDFSPACTEELCSLRDLHFEAVGGSATVYGISRDTLFTHEAFAYGHDLQFPLLSDVRGDVCRAYDAVHETDFGGGVEAGLPKRTVYVVDADRTIRYAWQTDDPYEQPEFEPALGALSAD